MSIQELKLSLHHFIDEIDNPNILEKFYEIVKRFRKKSDAADFWDIFTQEQKEEIENAWRESENEENTVSHDDVVRQSQTWLKK